MPGDVERGTKGADSRGESASRHTVVNVTGKQTKGPRGPADIDKLRKQEKERKEKKREHRARRGPQTLLTNGQKLDEVAAKGHRLCPGSVTPATVGWVKGCKTAVRLAGVV